MKPSLTQEQRTLLFFLSACGYAAWFAGLGEPLHAEALGAPPAPAFTQAPHPRLPGIASVVVRDPFADAETPRDDRTSTARKTVRPALAGTTISNDGDSVVPDIRTTGDAAVATLGLAVRATIVGPNPVAYVANGTAMDIVRIGDTLGDRRISSIDLRGIAFDDGSRLDLPGAFTASPSPAQKRSNAPVGIEDLRRLLAPLARGRPAAEPSAAASFAAAPPTPAENAYPTAGPLPTVDARGLPVGVNPTPDSHDPTPFPYPYPYAPASRR